MSDVEDYERAKALVQEAFAASRTLESSVREIVRIRAWTILGYANLAEMWEAETGYKLPVFVSKIVIHELAPTVRDNPTPTAALVAETGIPRSSIQAGRRQMEAGVPLENVVLSAGASPWVIDRYGTKPREGVQARPVPRRLGATPQEFVSLTVNVFKWVDDRLEEIARDRDVPKAEIVRQALAEYLERLGMSRMLATEHVDVQA